MLKSFPCTDGALSSRFDSKGTRLLCSELHQPLASYLVAPQWSANTGKMQFTDERYGMVSCYYSRSPCCFAGDNDELVVGASDGRDWTTEDNNIYIWSAPAWDGEIGRSTNNTPLQVLRGHKIWIQSVRYSVQNRVLASCDESCVVKLWSTDSF